LPLNPLYGEELKVFLQRFDASDPSSFADFAASLTSADAVDLQEVLETVPILERMQKVLLLLKKELEVAKIQTKIQDSVQERISANSSCVSSWRRSRKNSVFPRMTRRRSWSSSASV
tara:strand:+ start:58 stop:408 length:351 start_codon:yes stop_codon:yes gene_type:complete